MNHRALHGTGNRQHEVGHEGRRGHEVLENDQELDLLAGLEGHLRVAIGRKRIRAADEQRANLIRIAREDGLEDGRAMGLAHPLGGERLAPLVLGDLGETLVAGPGGHLVLVGADLLGTHLDGQTVVGLELLVGDVSRGTGHAVATGAIEVAADGTQDRTGMHAGTCRAAELIPGATPLDVAGTVGRVHAGGLTDELGIEPGEGRSPLRRVGLDVVAQLVKALAPLVDEVHVINELVHDDVDHGHGQGRVGTRTQRQPEIRVRGGLGVTRVDDDELQAICALQIGVAVHAGHGRRTGIEAPQDDALGRAEVGLERGPAVDGGLDHEGRDPAQQGVVEAVGRSEQVEEAAPRPVIGTQGTGGGGDCLCTGLFLDLVDLGGNLGQGLIPGDALPLVLALLARALHRVVDARRIVHERVGLVTASAQATGVGGMVRIAFGVDELAVLDVSQNAAVLMAEIAA